jgi:hypothetical protein
VLVFIGPVHLDNQQIFTLLIIYSSLVALWTCFVHTLYDLIPFNMRRAFFYAKYAPPLPLPFLIYLMLSTITPRRIVFIPLSFIAYLWLDVAVHESISMYYQLACSCSDFSGIERAILVGLLSFF